MPTYLITTAASGHVRAETASYSEALRLADAYTRADRILHTVRTTTREL